MDLSQTLPTSATEHIEDVSVGVRFVKQFGPRIVVNLGPPPSLAGQLEFDARAAWIV
jgi:hypothetical protein